MEPDRHQKHNHAGKGGRPGEKAERDQDAAEEFGDRKQRRPEGAGIEAEPLDHFRRAERIDDLGRAVDGEEAAGDDAQQRLGAVVQFCIEAAKGRNDQRLARMLGRHVGLFSCLLRMVTLDVLYTVK